MSYLGIKGFANNVGPAASGNATSILAYYDIFKNFYANKQEEMFPVIGGIKNVTKAYIYSGTITAGNITDDDISVTILTSGTQYIAIAAQYVKEEALLNDTYVDTTFNNQNRIYRTADIKKEGASWQLVKSDQNREYYILEVTNSQKEGTIKLAYRDWETDRKSTRLNSSHRSLSRMPSSA